MTCYTRCGCSCDLCRAAWSKHQKRWQHERRARAYRASPVGVVRKVQGLQWMGYSIPVIARRAGMTERGLLYLLRRGFVGDVEMRTKRAIDRVFTELCATPAPDSRSSQQARAYARRAGHAPPAAWYGVDIDDPNATPDYGETPRTDAEKHVALIAEVRSLMDLGLSWHEIARELEREQNSLARSFERWRKAGHTDINFPYVNDRKAAA